MDATTTSRARSIHDSLGHPVIDGDGHVLEPTMVLLDYVNQIAGPEFVTAFENRIRPFQNSGMKQIFWGQPSGPHTLDRATAILPKLYAERLEEAGIDFGVCYSTAILQLMHERNDEFRQVGHRALNTMLADTFAGVMDKLVPSMGIPMFTPEEAIAEIDFVTGELGMKAITVGTEVQIAPPIIEKEAPHLREHIHEVYPVAMDSLRDYDPVWQKCLDLGLAVASHTSARGTIGGRRRSPTNYVFNHLGDFAQGGEYFCRCLFMGGVTRRFPGLNFAFLEGGVGFATQLYNDLFEHWEKRNVKKLRHDLDPATLDLDLLEEMAAKYGGDILTPEAVRAQPRGNRMGGVVDGELEIDEFRALEIEKGSDIAELFAKPFYFGCEADDRLTAIAFDTRLNHEGAKLKAMFGSDIGHWDVTDMNDCVPDAYSLVEKGLLNEDEFRAFVFENPMSFFTDANPDFFKGTVVEEPVAKELAE
ncbi:MAG: amidohydrolase family protein [Pseudomonadota bacterium]|nr:amidohydrolase family protein [Pseudomonadota bacterium]